MIIQSIQLGDKVEIAEHDYIDNELIDINVWVSAVQELIDDKTLVVAAPIDNGRIIPLSVGKTFVLYVYTDKGLYKCHAQVIERFKEKNIHLLKVCLETKMVKIQRRQYYRLECLLNIKFSLKEEEWHEGIVLDISGGGMRFTSKKQLARGDIITCLLELSLPNGMATVNLNGKVLLSEHNMEENHYENRVKFASISNYDREIIIKYIFNEQRKRRQKEKGLI